MRPTAMNLLTLLIVLVATVTAHPQDLTGTHGNVITNGDASLNTSGVVLRAKASRASIAAQLGSSDGSFVVFGASGAALLRVQADGKFGIGTPTPRKILHLVQNNGTGIGPELILENNGGTINNASALTFSSDGDSRAQIRSGLDPSSAAGNLEFRTGISTLETRMTLRANGDVAIKGGAVPLLLEAATPVAVAFKDLNYYQELPHGIRMEMPGNSDIMVSRMQIGRWNAPIIQSLDGPLQLNTDTRHEVKVPAQFTVGDLQGDAGLLIVSGDNPLDSNAPTLTLARKDGSNNPIAAFAFSIDEQGKQLKLLYGTTDARPATPLLTIDASTPNGPQLTFNGAIVGAVWQDIAEWVPSDSDFEPGTVVVLSRGRTNAVTTTASPYDASVAGVVSAQPGVILGPAGEGKEMVATTGRVKVKVDATRHPIAIGDLLVSSDKPGRAMKSMPVEIAGASMHRPGTIIGKALEPLDQGEGEILVLLSLQ